jgi:sugar phosphate isomerase/epimerase
MPTRREFLYAGAAAAVAGTWPTGPGQAAQAAGDKSGSTEPPVKFKLGLVTYNLARDWDIPTIIKRCLAAGFEAVELRSTHAHGVEPGISKDRRREVRKQFADGGLRLLSLGTACQYHEPDPKAVEKNIEETKRFAELAADLGCLGIKVRPNGLPKDVPVPKTLEQIGKALRRCGEIGDEHGIEIWVEVHGSGTADPRHMRAIMDIADHPRVGVCWNSNANDLIDGSIQRGFDLLRPKLMSCHINELSSEYPWRDLFTNLRRTGYDRYTLAEVQGFDTQSEKDVLRIMGYYKALWTQLCRP